MEINMSSGQHFNAQDTFFLHHFETQMKYFPNDCLTGKKCFH